MALSTFCSVSDQDMANQIMPKVFQILQQDKKMDTIGFTTNLNADPFKSQNVKKKALLAALRIV